MHAKIFVATHFTNWKTIGKRLLFYCFARLCCCCRNDMLYKLVIVVLVLWLLEHWRWRRLCVLLSLICLGFRVFLHTIQPCSLDIPIPLCQSISSKFLIVSLMPILILAPEIIKVCLVVSSYTKSSLVLWMSLLSDFHSVEQTCAQDLIISTVPARLLFGPVRALYAASFLGPFRWLFGLDRLTVLTLRQLNLSVWKF